MARKGIPDCPVLNPEHDGFGAAKIFRGHPYEVEESYSYEYTTSSSSETNNTSDDDDTDYEDNDYEFNGDHYENCTFNGPSNYHINININVNAGSAIEMGNVLSLIKQIKALDSEKK